MPELLALRAASRVISQNVPGCPPLRYCEIARQHVESPATVLLETPMSGRLQTSWRVEIAYVNSQDSCRTVRVAVSL